MTDTRESLVIDVSVKDSVTPVLPQIKQAITGMAKQASDALGQPGEEMKRSLQEAAKSLGGAQGIQELKQQFESARVSVEQLRGSVAELREVQDAAARNGAVAVDVYIDALKRQSAALTLTNQERQEAIALLVAEKVAGEQGGTPSDAQREAIVSEMRAREELIAQREQESAELVRSQRLNAEAVAEELAGRSEVSRSLREAIQLRDREAETIRRSFETSQLARSQELNRGAVTQVETSRAQEIKELREAILARSAEAEVLRKNRVTLDQFIGGLRDERVLLQLDAKEREVVIAQRRAEDLAIKAGITDRQKLLQLIRQEVQETQKVRGAAIGSSGFGGVSSLNGLTGLLGVSGGPLGQIVSQAQQGSMALEGMASSAGVAAAGLGPIALAGAGIALTAGALGAAAKASAELDERLRPVAARSADLKAQLGFLKESIRDIASVTGRAQEELGAGLSAVIQSGTSSAGRAIEFLRVAADVARATGESIPSAIGSVDSVLDAFNLRATEARRVADQLFVAAQEGETTFGRFSGAMQRAGTVASELGIPLQDTAAFLATVSRRTGNVDEAASALVNVLGKLTGTTDPTRQRLVALGVDASAAAIRMKGLPAVLEEIRQKVGGRQDILADLFGGQRVASTFFAAVADTQGAARSLENIARANGEVAESAKRAATAGEEFSKAWNQLRQTSGIDQIGDGLVKLGAKLANFTSDFLRDHELLKAAAISSTGLLGLVALAAAAEGAPNAIDRASIALNKLGQSDAGSDVFFSARQALDAFNAKLDATKARIPELEEIIRNAKVGGVQVSQSVLDELAAAQDFVAHSAGTIAKRTNLRSTAVNLPLLILPQFLPQLQGATIERTADQLFQNAQGQLTLLAGKYTLKLPPPKVDLGEVAETFRSEKLKRDLERTLAELALTIGPLEVPANITAKSEGLKKALGNKDLLSFPTLDAKTAADQQDVAAFTGEQAQAQQLLIDLQARATHGIEQQRLQAAIGNGTIERTLALWEAGKENVDSLRSAFEAMKQAQAQAFDDAKVQQVLTTTVELSSAVADVLAKREDLARAQGDLAGADELGAAADKARARVQQDVLDREIEALAVRVRNGQLTQAQADTEVRSKQEQLDLEERIARETRRQGVENRRIDQEQALLGLQGQLLRGLDAELFRIHNTANAERLHLLVKQKLTDEDVKRLVLLGQIEAKESGDARASARLEVNQTLLGLQQDVARTYQEQFDVLGRIADAEDQRALQGLRDSGATDEQIEKTRVLLGQKRQQAQLELAVQEANKSAVQIAEQGLYNQALAETNRLLRGGAITAEQFGEALLRNLERARTGQEAFNAGIRSGIEDMRKLFADDFTQGVQIATDALRTFRDSGVSNLEEVLDGTKSLSEGLRGIGGDFLKSIRHNLLEGLFNQLGQGLIGKTGGEGGLLGGLFGGASAGGAASGIVLQTAATSLQAGSVSLIAGATALTAGSGGLIGSSALMGAAAVQLTVAAAALQASAAAGAASAASGIAKAGLHQGALVSGGTRPIYQAAGGMVARSRTLLDVAELPGLQELIAPLDRGRLPVHVDEKGGMRVRVRGAEVPVDLQGAGARRRADAAVFAGGARERSSTDTRAAARGEREGGSQVTIAPGAVVVNSAPVTIQIVSKDPNRAGSDVASHMPMIMKAIAADIERGTTRALRDAIRSASR